MISAILAIENHAHIKLPFSLKGFSFELLFFIVFSALYSSAL